MNQVIMSQTTVIELANIEMAQQPVQLTLEEVDVRETANTVNCCCAFFFR